MAPSRSVGRVWRSIISLALVSSTLAYDLTLCSSSNTGSSSQPDFSNYQSLGKCHDNCLSSFAFAIVQGDNCWCSNYAPADTVSSSKCDTACPGWPYEYCASGSAGVFGYLALTKSPSGTEGAATSQAASSTSSMSQRPPNTVTVQDTATVTPTPSISVFVVSIAPTTSNTPTTPTTSTKQTHTTPTTTSTSSSSWSATPYASVKTIQGGVQTITITPTQPPHAAQTDRTVVQAASNGFWSSTGKVAGTFTVVGLLIAALIGAAIFLTLRRRRNTNRPTTINSIDDDAPTSSNGAPYMVDRTGRRSNLTLATNGLGGLTRGSSNEKSPADKTPGSLSRRGSIPLHDQRLNPAALWSSSHPNGSHVSVASFRDDQDYSRPVLHVRNPDVD